MKRVSVMLLLLVMLFAGAQATMLLGRNGSVLKTYQFFGWVNAGYSQTALAWDAASLKYVDQSASARVRTVAADVNAMVGLPGRVEVGFDAPLAMKKQDTSSSTGLGDLMVLARYGLVQAKLSPVKVALVAGANLPTAKKGASPALGDRTLDLALGFSAITKKLGQFVGHARAAYWLDGKTNDTTKVGNMLEYVLVGDYYATPKIIPELTLSGYWQGQTEYNGSPRAKTEVGQHTLSVLLLTKPIPNLVIRPKAGLPLAFVSKGGKLPRFTVGLDVWATVP